MKDASAGVEMNKQVMVVHRGDIGDILGICADLEEVRSKKNNLGSCLMKGQVHVMRTYEKSVHRLCRESYSAYQQQESSTYVPSASTA